MAGPTEVLVATVASVISPGTERAVTALAQSSLLAKARARPDLVRQVVSKARSEGLASTAQAVRSRLADDLPLGYSAAGEVVAVGSAVSGIGVGQLVATGGQGKPPSRPPAVPSGPSHSKRCTARAAYWAGSNAAWAQHAAPRPIRATRAGSPSSPVKVRARASALSFTGATPVTPSR